MGVSTRRTLRPSPREVKTQNISTKTPKKIAKNVASSSKSHKNIENLTDVLSEFHNTNGEFDHFFVTNENECKRYKNIAKHLYDHLQKKRIFFDTKFQAKLAKKETMKNLIVNGFDNEQIWQQLEMFNQPFMKNIVSDVASFLTKKSIITLNVDLGETKPKTKKVNENVKRNTKFVFDDESDEDMEMEDELELNDEEDNEDEDDNDDETEVLPQKSSKKSKNNNKPNEKVEFFDPKEMNAYLDAEDAKEMNDNVEEPFDENDVDIDYFANIPSDDDEDEDGNDDMMYADFFDPPTKKAKKVVTFQEGKDKKDDDEEEDDDDQEIDGLDTRDFDQDDDDNDVEEDDEEEEEEDGDVEQFDEEMEDLEKAPTTINDSDIFANSSSDEDEEESEVNQRLRNLASQNFGDNSDDDLEGKSEYEKSQALLKRKIEKAQRELLQPAALNWKLAGESISDARPENSLLEEHLDFDHVSRPAPIITDDTTKTLEDLIRQRIKDKAFDDVQRKIKPKDKPFEFRRRLMVDSEKSKASLAEVYENEYLKKQQQDQPKPSGFIAAGDAEDSENRKQIRRMMKSLFQKLDALSAVH